MWIGQVTPPKITLTVSKGHKTPPKQQQQHIIRYLFSMFLFM